MIDNCLPPQSIEMLERGAQLARSVPLVNALIDASTIDDKCLLLVGALTEIYGVGLAATGPINMRKVLQTIVDAADARG